jgi:F420-non-reducing hydrogenase iron-sulfur subunit
MCSGRIDPGFILHAFAKGADGVLVCGCHPGDCHYVEGNYKCMRRMPLTKKILKDMGIAPERLRLEWVSASEGGKFQHVVTEFTEQIRTLGPLELKDRNFTPEKENQVDFEALGAKLWQSQS